MGGKWRWTYEACYEEAKKYHSRTEFSECSYLAYTAASKKGWLKDYTWFERLCKPNGYWSYERCAEEAKKYKTKTEFQKKSSSAYQKALRNGWLNEYSWFENGYSLQNIQRAVWTYEKVRDLAIECKTLKEFYTKSKSAHCAALRHGWIDEFDWLKRGNCPYKENVDNVYAYIFNKQNAIYIGRSIEPFRRDVKHHTDDKSTVNKFAKQNNTAIPEMTILESGLTLENGLEKEDYYVNKYRSEGWNVLNKAKTGKRSGSLGGVNSGKWTYNKCYKEAKKYSSKGSFCQCSPSAYQSAKRNGWLDDYDWMKTRNRG